MRTRPLQETNPLGATLEATYGRHGPSKVLPRSRTARRLSARGPPGLGPSDRLGRAHNVYGPALSERSDGVGSTITTDCPKGVSVGSHAKRASAVPWVPPFE